MQYISRNIKLKMLIGGLFSFSCMYIIASVDTTSFSSTLNSTSNYHSISNLSGLEGVLINNPNTYNFDKQKDIPEPLAVSEKAKELTDYVNSLYHKVVSEDLKSRIANPLISHTLPYTISKRIGNTEQQIIIDSVVFSPEGPYLSAAASVEFPGKENKRLSFYGAGIQFHKGGFSGITHINLTENIDFDFFDEKVTLNFKADRLKTYVDFDCNGFKNIGIDADVIFSRDLLLPVNDNGEVIQDNSAKVVSSFSTEVSDLSELLIETSISPFQAVKLKDFVFSVQEASLDMSDLTNPVSLEFPNSYPEENTALWRGFFMKNITVTLPPCFKKKAGVSPVISANNLIIDKNGLTALFSAQNLISLDEGSMSGWQFSLDNINVKLFTGSLQECNFNGQIVLPISNESSKIAYSGYMDIDGNYFFSLDPVSDISADLWKAELSIAPGSELGITVENNDFRPYAVLNGSLSINDDSKGVSANGISFQELRLQTVKPFVSAKVFSFNTSSQSESSKFPITIEDVSFLSKDEDIGIGLTATLNLTSAKNNNFGAATSLEIWAQPKDDDSGIFRYEYKSTHIGDISIDIDAGAFKLSGELSNYDNDNVFGKGFSGKVSAWFLPGISIDAAAQFGTVNNYRYWYADAMAGFKKGIPVFPAFAIYGFGGGASMHMKRTEPANLKILPSTPAVTLSDTPAPGFSGSGVKYIPDNNTGLGVRAKVIAGTYPGSKAFNSEVGLEMLFNANGGGVQQLNLDGSASFMSDIEAEAEGKSIYATVKMTYDVPAKTFFASSNIFLNAGGGLIKGNGAKNLAGSSEMFFSRDNWYINIGTLSSRIDISIMNKINLNAYFMTGKTLPPMPDLDPKITKLLNIKPSTRSVMSQSGAGFAFGAALNTNTGEKSFGPFYASFESTIGFDIMMKNLGSTSCNGRTGAVGINGWYASGQAYAYFLGNIGLNVDMPFYSGKFEIMEGEFGALLQAQLPNPTWMLGAVGGEFHILNGLINGKCNFSVEIGEQCEISSLGALAGTEIISELSPNNNETDVSVYNAPQAVFNMPINKSFSFDEMDGTTRTMKIVLDRFVVSNNGHEIDGDISWNENRDVAVFQSHEILPSEQRLTANVSVKYKELIKGRWEPVYAESGEAKEEKECSFTVGIAPPYIDPNNVKYAYPIDRQKYLYKEESVQAYITLKRGRSDLFNPDKNKWKQVVRFSASGNNVAEENLMYDAGTNTVSFSFPKELVNSTIYNLKIVNKPLIKVKSNDENVSEQNKELSLEKGGEISAKIKDAKGTIDYYEEEDLYNIVFATSMYNTFAEKIDNLNIDKALPWFLGTSDIYTLMAYFNPTEYFDKNEISGNNYSRSMLVPELDKTSTWFDRKINPLIYEPLPINGNINISSKRQNDQYGVPPFKAVSIYQENESQLQEFEIQSNTITNNKTPIYVNYDMPEYTYEDYFYLRSQCAAYYINSNDQSLKKMIETEYTNPIKGNYKVKLAYYLPGKTSPTTVKNINLDFNF